MKVVRFEKKAVRLDIVVLIAEYIIYSKYYTDITHNDTNDNN